MNEIINLGAGKAMRHHEFIMMKLAGLFYYVRSGSGPVSAERWDPDRVQNRTGSVKTLPGRANP